MFESNSKNALKERIKQVLSLSADEIIEAKNKGIAISKKYTWNHESEKLYRIMYDEINRT